MLSERPQEDDAVMPNPISTLHAAKSTSEEASGEAASQDSMADTEAGETKDEFDLEVDELLDADGDKPMIEVDPLDEPAESRSEASADHEASPFSDETEEASDGTSKGRLGLIAVVLAALLIGSFAINMKQSRDVQALETKNQEFEQALTSAIERIDAEAARATSAEAALDRVDTAVDVVNERVLGLQEALDGLREATVR
jgi:hypothetical protein